MVRERVFEEEFQLHARGAKAVSWRPTQNLDMGRSVICLVLQNFSFWASLDKAQYIHLFDPAMLMFLIGLLPITIQSKRIGILFYK